MIYEPAEDSYLLEKWVRKLARGNVLDIGTGSGIQAAAAAEKAEKVVAVDIDSEAIEYASKKFSMVEFRQGNLFRPIKKDERFDLIVFNPPYLPEDRLEKSAITTGGKEGWEIIARFLKGAKKHLNKEGKILIVFSSLTHENKVLELAKKEGFSAKLLEKKHISFEDIFVYELRRVR
jgi:release factor glutamine methyltransferase